MLDLRFYVSHGPLAVEALFPDADIIGDRKTVISGAAALEAAAGDELAYLEARPRGPLVTAAGAVVVSRETGALLPDTVVKIIDPRPRWRFARAVGRLVSEVRFQDRGPAISPDAAIEADVRLAPGVVVGPGARIGAESEIGPNAVIGPGVAIGRRARIGAGASIRCALIGDDVTILAGAAIGEPGFAVAPGPGGLTDVPHIGRVIVQDRVTLAACVTVDRGLFGDTVICEGAKIDNLSQIAHNCVIGRNVVMAAFAGISGSCRIGDGAMLGGRVGVADHITVGADARIAAGSAVLQDVPARETWAGYPAKPLRRWARENAWLAKAIGARHVGD